MNLDLDPAFTPAQTVVNDGDRRRQREGWPAGKADVPASRMVADAVAPIARSRPVDGR